MSGKLYHRIKKDGIWTWRPCGQGVLKVRDWKNDNVCLYCQKLLEEEE